MIEKTQALERLPSALARKELDKQILKKWMCFILNFDTPWRGADF